MPLKMPAKQKRHYQKLYGINEGPLVKAFTPFGRSGFYIYAVSVRHHPDKVKIGMTTNWKSRRFQYANWNLSSGDAVTEEKVFCITDEFVDLPKLERHILQSVSLGRAHGNEWFFGTVDDAARQIDQIMCSHGISYDLQPHG